jgi:hypothetical protein
MKLVRVTALALVGPISFRLIRAAATCRTPGVETLDSAVRETGPTTWPNERAASFPAPFHRRTSGNQDSAS